MSKVDELIKQYCPEGVEYKQIGDIADCRAGATPKSGNSAFWDDGTIPWMSSGEVNNKIIYDTDKKITQAGYDSCSTRMVPSNTVVMALAGQGKTRGLVARTRISLCTNQSLCSIIPNDSVDSDFLYYFLSTQYQQLRSVSSGDGTRGGLNLQMIRGYRIPVPPIEVQKEIVNILDKFTQLEAELEAELEARRKQYEYYRNQLLTFDDEGGVRWTTLGEIGMFTRGNGLQKKDFTESGVGCIHYGQIYTHYGTFTENTKTYVSPEVFQKAKKAKSGDLVIATTSENDEDVCKAVAWLGDEDIAISNHTAIFSHNENPKYIAYVFQTKDFFKQKKRYIKGTKVKDVSAQSLAKFTVGLPPRDEQDRIVSILDKFDSLVNSISEGLPAELSARRKQYEYYRSKLLTFHEAGV